MGEIAGRGQAQRKRFFTTLEGLRGAAAILVLFRHITSYIDPFSFQMSYLAVDLFFILSGTVIANAYEKSLLSGAMSFKEFATLRVARIFPLYLFGSAIGLAAMALNGSAGGANMTLFAALALVMLPSPIVGLPLFPLNHPAWSLLFEFFANFCYGKYVRRLPNRTLAGLVALSFLLLLAGAALNGLSLDLGWTRRTLAFGFFRVLFSFGLGVLLYRAALPRLDGSLRLGPVSATVILAVSVLVLTAPVGKAIEPYCCVAALAVIFPALVFLSMFVTLPGSFESAFRFLGELSFPLYALHAPLYALSHALLGAQLDPLAPYSGLAFAFFAIAVSFSVHLWIDVPFRRALRGGILKRFASQ